MSTRSRDGAEEFNECLYRELGARARQCRFESRDKLHSKLARSEVSQAAKVRSLGWPKKLKTVEHTIDGEF